MRFVLILFAATVIASILVPQLGSAQTVYEVPDAKRQVTISKGDLEAAMTPAEIADLKEFNDTLERHAAYGRSFPAGSKGRQDAKKIFDDTKRERDDKYKHLAGMRGQTVTAHGMPPPTGAEIVMVIMQQRLFNSGSGMLHAHWIRERAGGVYGSATAPVFDDQPADGYLGAGDTVIATAQIGSAEGSSTTGSADAVCLEAAGPVPDDWDYDWSGEPICKCFPESTLYGVTPCNWVRSIAR